MVLNKIKDLFSKNSDSYQDELENQDTQFASDFNDVSDQTHGTNEVNQTQEVLQSNEKELISSTLDEINQDTQSNKDLDPQPVEKPEYDNEHYQQEMSAFSNEEDISPFQRDDMDSDNDNGSDSDNLDLITHKETEPEPKEVYEERHVTFIDTKEYMKVPTLKDMISRKKEQLNEEALLKRLNINVLDKEQLDPLESKKLNYAQKRLYSNDVQSSIQNYLDRMERLIENTQLNLNERHGKALRENFEERAFDNIESVLIGYDHDLSERISEYKEDREAEYAKREEALKEQHEKEIEALKSQLETKFHQFKQEQEPVKRQEIELYQLEQEEKIDRKKKKALIDETYRQEQQESTALIQYKSEILEESTKNFKQVSDEEQAELNTILKAINEEIESKVSDWSVEVTEEAKRELELQRYQDEKVRQDKLIEAEAEEKRLKLKQKKEEFESKQRQLERENELKEKELDLRIEELKNQLSNKNNHDDEYKQLLLELVKQSYGQSQPLYYPNVAQTPIDEYSKKNESNHEKKNRFWELFLVGLAFSSVFLSNVYFHNRLVDSLDESSQQPTVNGLIEQPEQNSPELDIVNQLDKIEERLDDIEQDKSITDDSSEEEEVKESVSDDLSLRDDPENFIKANDFKVVLENLGGNPTEEMLNIVSDIYRHNHAIYELLALNEDYQYLYSDYDQAVLRNDIHQIHSFLLHPEYWQFESNGNKRLDDTLNMLYDHHYYKFSKQLIKNVEGQSNA